jgi:hypothetical protein
MRQITAKLMMATVLALVPASSRADSVFVGHLDGAQETPPNPSPGTGLAVVDLNNAMDSISVTLDWQDLLAGATAASIHEGAPGVAGPIVFSLMVGSGAGTTTGSIDPSPQTFAITATEVADLQAGLFYVEVDTSLYPAGEIRGQLSAVPEPGSLALAGTAIALGLVGYGWRARARRG